VYEIASLDLSFASFSLYQDKENEDLLTNLQFYLSTFFV